MQSPLLSAPAFGGGGGDSSCCSLFSKPQKSYTDQDASFIIEHLQKLARAKRHQIVGLQHLQAKAELDAVTCKNHEQALSYVRISKTFQADALSEQAKYEQLIKLSNKIESARRNLEMAATMFASAKTLQQVLEAMPVEQVQSVTDELRELFVQHEQNDRELARPRGSELNAVLLEDELERLVEQRKSQKHAEIEKTNFGQVQQEKNVKQAMLN